LNTLIIKDSNIRSLKKGIWLYFILIIFEGALRKWVLPGLSNQLLIIRDPVAIWLLLSASNAGLKYFNGYANAVFSFTIIAFFTALTIGHHNFWVALFGARITLIHFPLIFIIGKVFSREDILAFGKFIVILSIPMVFLTMSQFYSPQSAWVNRGVGGNLEGAGFAGANGYFRPPGTFAFTNGNSAYFSFAASYIIYFLFYVKSINKILINTSAFCLILAIPLSISRTLFFSVALSTIFLVLSLGNDKKKVGQIITSIIGLIIIGYVIGSLTVFQTSSLAFTDRFTTANENEGGGEGLQAVIGVFTNRILGGLLTAFNQLFDGSLSFWGQGIGMGTNVGSQLLTGKVDFLIAEGEWGRIVGEVGPLLGLGMILIRSSLTFSIVRQSFNLLIKKDPLPWMLLSYSFFQIFQGGWSQPTNLGFFVMGAGLTIAAIETHKENEFNGI